jgi:hypothetical protein
VLTIVSDSNIIRAVQLVPFVVRCQHCLCAIYFHTSDLPLCVPRQSTRQQTRQYQHYMHAESQYDSHCVRRLVRSYSLNTTR